MCFFRLEGMFLRRVDIEESCEWEWVIVQACDDFVLSIIWGIQEDENREM